MTGTAKYKTAVLDSSFFFLDIPVEAESYAVPQSVADEMKDIRAKSKFDTYLERGMKICEPSQESLAKTVEAAKKSGDFGVISKTDTDAGALALELGAVLVTDDYALSNTAMTLGLTVVQIQMRKAKKRQWKYQCRGCMKVFTEKTDICDVCGSEVIRVSKPR